MHDLVFDENDNALMIYRMRGNQGIPWHNLGTAFHDDISLEKAILLTQMDRHIELIPATYGPDGKPIPGCFAVVDDKERCYGVVKGRYTLLQDYKAAQGLRPLIDDHGFTIETAGLLKGGARSWIQLQAGLTADVRGGDQVRGFVLFTNSHDGSGHAQLGGVNTRVVCANTLASAKSEGTLAKLRHTGDIETKFDSLVKAYECNFRDSVEVWKAMAGRVVHQSDLTAFLDEFTGKTADDAKRSGGLRDTITEAFESGIGNTGSTVWDLYNGVTQVVSHSEGRGSDTAGDKAARALESQWFGAGKKQIERAQSILMRSL